MIINGEWDTHSVESYVIFIKNVVISHELTLEDVHDTLNEKSTL